MSDQVETSELRKRLRGAIEDLKTAEGTEAALRASLREQDHRLEAVTAERDRFKARTEQLQGWKARFVSWILELPEDQRAGMPEPEGVDL